MQNPEWIWTFLDATKRKIIHCLSFRLSCLLYIYITRLWTGHMPQYTMGNHIRKLNVYICYIIKKEYINLPVLRMHLPLLVLYLFSAIVLIPILYTYIRWWLNRSMWRFVGVAGHGNRGRALFKTIQNILPQCRQSVISMNAEIKKLTK